MSTGGAPLFRQLARALGEAIGSGGIAIGDLLPTEAELARRYNVSRHTVREALSELKSRGLIESRQGVGSIVVRSQSLGAYTETYSSIEELTRFAKGTPIRVHGSREIIADEELAGLLRGKAGQSYLHIEGLRFDSQESDMPVGHVDVHVEGAYAGVRSRLADLSSSIAEAIGELYGLSIARIDQEISVELLSPEHARRLKVPDGTPALVIRRWYAADNGRIFEVAFSRYPMGRFAYRNVLMRNDK